MLNEHEWYQSIYNDLIQNNKRLIFIAGGSSSGKSHNAEQLEKYLGAKNLKVLRFSTDNYYKGLSRVIVGKTVARDKFKQYQPYEIEISKIVKSITEHYAFKDKFKQENFYQIMNRLSGIVSHNDMFDFVSTLKYEQENMNFDDPFDIDFDWIVDTITKLKNKQIGTLSDYSFNTSEIVESGIKQMNGARYDVIIVEGLYILRPEVLDYFGSDEYVSSSIASSGKTRLIRRLHRDIFTDRCSLTPEETILTVLKNVMPGFISEIEPTFKQSKYELTNNLSTYEKDKKQMSCQTKYAVTKQHKDVMAQFLSSDSVTLVDTEEIRDLYLQDNINDELVLRLRICNDKLHLLSFKTMGDTQDRRVEHFPLHSYLSDVNAVDEFVNMLKSSGFEISNEIIKTRETYSTTGFEDVCEFRVDFIKNLGVFVEIDNLSARQTEDFANALKLKLLPNKSYETLYNSQLINNA
ncbi:MAG: CYTH domain-containing protein [Clostridia bacterium]|nr:CYTH domain-containing protein [Clostridia bacterium]